MNENKTTPWVLAGMVGLVILIIWSLVDADSARSANKHKKFRDLAAAFYAQNPDADSVELRSAAEEAFFTMRKKMRIR